MTTTTPAARHRGRRTAPVLAAVLLVGACSPALVVGGALGEPAPGEPASAAPPPAGAASATRGGTRPTHVPLRAAAARDGAVEVRSEPYWDADCGCTLVLTLTARQVGDTLAGAFSARGAATAAAESRGRVVRAAPGPAIVRVVYQR